MPNVERTQRTRRRLRSGHLIRHVTTLECPKLRGSLLTRRRAYEVAFCAELETPDNVLVHLDWRGGPLCEVPWDAVSWERPGKPVTVELHLPTDRRSLLALNFVYDDLNNRAANAEAIPLDQRDLFWCERTIVVDLVTDGCVKIATLRARLIKSSHPGRVRFLREAFNKVETLLDGAKLRFVSEATLRSAASAR